MLDLIYLVVKVLDYDFPVESPRVRDTLVFLQSPTVERHLGPSCRQVIVDEHGLVAMLSVEEFQVDAGPVDRVSHPVRREAYDDWSAACARPCRS